MSAYTPRWLGVIHGYKTNGRNPWQVSIEMPEGPGIFNGTGPTVNFERGQRVHVLTDEGLAEVERAAAEKAWTRFVDVLSAHHEDMAPGVVADMERRNPYSKTKEEHDD